jgi:hypothetical protein
MSVVKSMIFFLDSIQATLNDGRLIQQHIIHKYDLFERYLAEFPPVLRLTAHSWSRQYLRTLRRPVRPHN